MVGGGEHDAQGLVTWTQPHSFLNIRSGWCIGGVETVTVTAALADRMLSSAAAINVATVSTLVTASFLCLFPVDSAAAVDIVGSTCHCDVCFMLGAYFVCVCDPSEGVGVASGRQPADFLESLLGHALCRSPFAP